MKTKKHFKIIYTPNVGVYYINNRNIQGQPGTPGVSWIAINIGTVRDAGKSHGHWSARDN